MTLDSGVGLLWPKQAGSQACGLVETPLDKTMWYSSSSSAYGFWLDTDLFRMISSCPSGLRMWISPINFTAVAAQMNSLPDLCTSALRSIGDGQFGGMLGNSSCSQMLFN